MKKLGLVIVDGVGYRNFVLSNFLHVASSEFKEVIIYSGLKKEVYKIQKFPNVKIKELAIFYEPKSTWFYRKLNETAHLYRFSSYFGIKDTLSFTKPKGISKRALLIRIIRLIAFVFHTKKHLKFYQKRIYKSFSQNDITKSYIDTLKTDKPSVLFFTHQRPPYIAPLAFAATICNIKTVSFIFSWDNLTSKGRIPVVFDSFLVWSDLMKTELQQFYHELKSSSIKIVGTPQFEPYDMPEYEISKDNFINKFNLVKDRKTICFSCGDLSTGGNDVFTINCIAKAIKSKKIIEPINFIVRLSPADDGERFKSLIKKYNFISWNKPKWIQTRENHPEPWSQRVPLKEDLVNLRALLQHADVSINMCSTMSLDFMIFNKPVINTVFGNKQNSLFNDQKFLKYNHYQKVVKSNAVTFVKNENALIDAINDALKNPNLKSQERKELLTLEISKPIKWTSSRIVKTLLNLENA